MSTLGTVEHFLLHAFTGGAVFIAGRSRTWKGAGLWIGVSLAAATRLHIEHHRHQS